MDETGKFFSLVACLIAAVVLAIIVAIANYNMTEEQLRAEHGYVDCGYMGSRDPGVNWCEGPACATAAATCARSER